VTGHSSGAMMAQRLACERADRFAAAASVAGSLTSARCSPSAPVSLLEIHGTSDAEVSLASAASAVAAWRTADRCEASAQVVTAGPVTTRAWRCAQGSEVRLVEIAGAQHPWPGARIPPPAGQIASDALDASSVVWGFLANHSRVT
jgi:polyhydroxybutyrate depolymerase